MKKNKRPALKWVWIVQVCDYEACWPLFFFDSEKKAQQYLDRYELKDNEQTKEIYQARIF